MTTTLSPLRIRFMSGLRSEHFGRKRDDLHDLLGAQLAGNRPENTGTDRLELIVEEDGCVTVETDHGAIGAADTLGGTNHHGVVHLTLLDLAAGNGVLDGHLDDITDAGVTALRAAQHLDAHHFLRAAVICCSKRALYLNHGRSP